MTNTLKQRKQAGFTIIEVLIVLAIAGLIMLVVFLAVPALQRSQRNNGRQSEATRLSSAVSSFISNSQGNNPATAADVTSIISDFGTFKYFTGINATGITGTRITAGKVAVVTQASFTPHALASSGNDGVAIVTGATCGTASTQMAVGPGTTRQVAVVYTLESTGTNYNQACVQAE